MKKFLIPTLALAFLLAGCGAISPAQPTVAPPSNTPVVVVATVLVPVTVVQTQAAPPTEVPTNTPVPPAQVPPTSAPANTSAAPSSGQATATATLPADAGGNLFTSLSRSNSFISLRCLPQEITFSVSTSNAYVTDVDFYYRFEDLTTQPAALTEWKNAGKMTGDKNGNFTVNFNVLQINPDLRATEKAWFDYEFIGLSKTGDAVGRSGKISQQILYLKNCP